MPARGGDVLTDTDRSTVEGSRLFARYAHPPNELGYCGPDGFGELMGRAGTDDALAAAARLFDGAWPYLRWIAGAVRGSNPLDREVVEAYWVGSDLLERVDPQTFAHGVRRVFRSQAGVGLGCLAHEPAAVPHHNFHVFAVYPWVGLLAAQGGGTPLRILDSCRIGWGRVSRVEDDAIDVESQPLEWADGALGLGEPRTESAQPVPGSTLVLDVGDLVSLHWQRVCDRIDPAQVEALRGVTDRQLQITNLMLADGR